MSARERAILILDSLTERQLEAFIALFGEPANWDDVTEETPDEWDKQMIADSENDNDETVTFDELLEKLGVEPDDI